MAQSSPDSTKGNFRMTGASSAIPHWQKGDRPSLSLAFKESSVRVTPWDQAGKEHKPTMSVSVGRQKKQSPLEMGSVSLMTNKVAQLPRLLVPVVLFTPRDLKIPSNWKIVIPFISFGLRCVVEQI